jgi:hypothetical protein
VRSTEEYADTAPTVNGESSSLGVPDSLIDVLTKELVNRAARLPSMTLNGLSI